MTARRPLRAALAAAVAAVALAGCTSGPADTPPAAPPAAAAPAAPSVTGPSATVPAPAGPAVPAPAPGGRRYVALGDSYTASPGTGPLAGPPPGCGRSTNNYPHLVAAATGAALTDVSCNGARTPDLTAAQVVRGGSNAAQFGALGPDTELVTVGIGGNDFGYGEIVGACLSLDARATPCRDRYLTGGVDRLRARIDTLGPVLTRVHAEIRRRSPAARVVVVGYPTILPAEGPGCFPTVPYTPGDVEYLRGVLGALDDEIAARAEQAGATYVDTATPTVGHDICTPPGTKWVEGLLTTSPGIPVHPNALGQEAMARAVLDAL